VTGYVAARRTDVKRRGRWRAGLALIPRGEFSVVIAALAVGAGVDARLGPLTAAYVLLTIVVAAALQKLPNRLATTKLRQRQRERERDRTPALESS
jgi:CPA2 family monovalent cation:H+ antiporter-2